ncbi:MAG: hydroxymethylbilane synthase [Alphaproteobacteria bacterium]|nr:hydroxymethylbilane synthase [Alphaproteobacteria bacterium]
MSPRLRIGTRGSPLALAQANEVRHRLTAAHGDLPAQAIEIVVISTSGDRVQDRPLAEIGGKGLFTLEIEQGLLSGGIDLAVHSMKDMPTELPAGLDIPCLLPREDARDVLISQNAAGLDELPPGAVIGSASLRRRAQLLHRRPDLQMVNFRGNVETRLQKVAAGEVDATLLALAGLKRLGLAGRGEIVIEPEVMLPAVAQGAIGIECRSDDTRILALLAPLNDAATATCVAAERGLLAALDGSCRTPIAGHAVLAGQDLHLRALVLRPDGSEMLETERRGKGNQATALGRDAGQELRRRAGPDFFVAS